jgi:hypothetical protein
MSAIASIDIFSGLQAHRKCHPATTDSPPRSRPEITGGQALEAVIVVEIEACVGVLVMVNKVETDTSRTHGLYWRSFGLRQNVSRRLRG